MDDNLHMRVPSDNLKTNYFRMKRAFSILIFVVLAQLCLATGNRMLPEVPWKAIVEMTKYSPNSRWEDNISVKLLGNCTHQDSAMVINAIETLNGLTETIKLNLTSDDWGTLQVFFIDSTNCLKYQKLFNLYNNTNYGYTYTNKLSTPTSPGLIAHYSLALQLPLVPDSVKQNFITNRLAFCLFPVYWNNDEGFKNGGYEGPASIFLAATTVEMHPYYSELIDFDRKVIKAVYASNYTELLPIAKKQFKKFRLPRWVDHNSISLLIFPFVLVLFLFVGLFILLYRKFFVHIKNKLLQFNVISVLALLTIGSLMSLTSTATFMLIYPYAYPFYWKHFFQALLSAIIIGLPAVNIFRLIEIAIHRKTQHKYIKTLLLFLSTSLIPSGTLLSIAYISFRKDLDNEGIQAMIIVFLVFVVIGIIRALISFFILKEKELKIENELKLSALRELKTKAELNALHSKINPHFLYNSLNSIAGLAKTDANKTEHMALSLSKLFRYSINKEQSDWSTLAEEMEMVNVYLDIEKVRFDERLEFTIDLPNELKTLKIPRFIIQPLVENSIKHGVSQLIGKGKIAVTARQDAQWLEIRVHDNGPNFPTEMAPGFGLQSIYDKLEIMYPNRFELHFVNSPQKQVVIKLK
jgi:sensor histidine kinase YesM